VVSGNLVGGENVPAGYAARSRGNHADLPVWQRDGRSLNLAANGPFGLNGYLDANGRIGADGKTLYISFLQQPNGTMLFYEFEFHRGDLGDPGRIGGLGNDQAGDNVNLRTGGMQTPIGPGSTNVNFYVVRIDFKAGNDDVHVYMNPTSDTEPESTTLSMLGASDMSFSGFSFGAFVNERTVRHDEIRVGTTWASVLGAGYRSPIILTQPQDQTVSAGGNATFTVAADGTNPLTYRWYKGASEIAVTTNDTLTLTNVQLAVAGSYSVIVSNEFGSAPSSVVALAVPSTIPTTPTNITCRVSAGQLTIAWPDNYLGWILQGQTNALGLGTNWIDLPGTAALTATNMPVNLTNPSVFFRLRHP
jgi:hypothetical protein